VSDEELPRFCSEAQSQLPALASGELTGWPARVVKAHLRHCESCQAEWERQESLAAGLEAMREGSPESPPEELLGDLLALTDKPGIRERVAVPTRGAVSGARPGLSVAFLTAGAVASTTLGWAAWKGFQRLRRN